MWQYLVCAVLKTRESTALGKSAHHFCSHLVCAGFCLCYVQLLVGVTCIFFVCVLYSF